MTAPGWRVEFRPTEVQVTDFENAAYVVFVVLLSRVILSYHLNLYIPITKVPPHPAAAAAAHPARSTRICDVHRSAAQCWARSSRSARTCPVGVHRAGAAASRLAGSACALDHDHAAELAELTIDTIINGKAGEFIGLIPLMHEYLNAMSVQLAVRCVRQPVDAPLTPAQPADRPLPGPDCEARLWGAAHHSNVAARPRAVAPALQARCVVGHGARSPSARARLDRHRRDRV